MSVQLKEESSNVAAFHGTYQELQWMIQSFVTFMEIIALIMPWDQFHLMSVTVLLTALDHILVYLSPASQWITQVIGTGYTDCTIMIIKI